MAMDRLRILRLCAVIAVLIALDPLRAAGQPCSGDCDGNGQVSVNELVLGVDIALGSRPLSDCQAFDADGSGTVMLNELVQAVNHALGGCPAATPTRGTPTATATRTSVSTPPVATATPETTSPTATSTPESTAAPASPTATPSPVPAFNVCGGVAARPDQPGFAEGVTVTLEPLGLVANKFPPTGVHCFDDVPSGTYTLVVSPTCNPFGCWEPTTLVVADRDVLDFVVPSRPFSPTPGPGTPSVTPTPPATVTDTPTVTRTVSSTPTATAHGLLDRDADAHDVLDADGDRQHVRRPRRPSLPDPTASRTPTATATGTASPVTPTGPR